MTVAKIEKKVLETFEALHESWVNKEKIETLKDYFHNDVSVICSAEPGIVYGKEALYEIWKGFVDMAVLTKWKTTDVKISIFNEGKSALVIYNYELGVEIQGQAMAWKGPESFTFVEENGKWLLMHKASIMEAV